MTEKLDRKQLKLKKYQEESDNIRGELWKSADWSYSVLMGHYPGNLNYPGHSPTGFSNNWETWDAYEVKYPDLGDGQPVDWTNLYNAVDFVCTSSDDEFKAKAADYFDLPLLLDYYILMETTLSADNHGKNMYFMTYNRNKSSKISFSIWDLDATCGRRWNSATISPDQDYTNYITYNEHGDYNLFRRMKSCNVNNFNDSVRIRYRDLRETSLHTDSLLQRFYDYKNSFDHSGASAREVARWNHTDAGSLNFDHEMDYLTNWFAIRMAYLDEMWDIANLPPSSVGDQLAQNRVHITPTVAGSTLYIHTNGQTHLRVVDLSGTLLFSEEVAQGVTTLLNLRKGVYIVNNRKVIVR